MLPTGDTIEDKVYAVLAAQHTDRSAAEIAAAVDLDEPAAASALEALVGAGRAEVLTAGRYLSNVAAGRLRESARRTLSTYHRQNPFVRAMRRKTLREALTRAAVVSDFNALLLWLAAQGILLVEDDGRARLPDHEVVLPPHWSRAAEEMFAVYEVAGLTPPAPVNFQANYPRDVNVRTILNVLADQGKLVHIGEDLYLSVAALATAQQAVRQIAAMPEGVTVSALRDATGSSRKIAMSLLEYLDAQKFIERQGDKRVLAPQGSAGQLTD